MKTPPILYDHTVTIAVPARHWTRCRIWLNRLCGCRDDFKSWAESHMVTNKELTAAVLVFPRSGSPEFDAWLTDTLHNELLNEQLLRLRPWHDVFFRFQKRSSLVQEENK